MKCLRCDSENNDASRFCGSCAAPLGAGAGSEAVSLTKTLETPVQVMKPGTVIAGKYKILEELGHGGMGVVYKAEDTRLQRTVALKFLPPELTHIPEIRDRFRQEAKAAAALDHPNICTVYDFDQAEDRAFISMAYIEGQSLRKRIDSGPLELEEALKIAAQVAEGLQEAHGKGIVHRDIKSANLMVTPKGQAKVMDFGLARVAGASLVTQEGTTMGTVSYMSPEQARGEKVDHRTDIWSFGVVLYEMLSGELPFKGEQSQAIVYSILKEKPKPLTGLRPGLPPAIEQVVLKALEKEPDKRYQSFEDMLDDLKGITAGIVPDEIQARLRRARIVRRRRVLLYAGAAAVVIVAVLALLVLARRAEVLKPLKAVAQTSEPEKSIAVLPFINDSPDQENTYFINGVMEEILGNLQKIKALRVISRTSVERYRERKKSVRQIAKELGVNYIVEGSAQKYGNAFRLRAQLIMAEHETHLWGESFQQKITDVEDLFNIQIRIAKSIAEELKAVISPEEKKLIEKIPTADLEVYDQYLKARSYWSDFTRESLYEAIDYLNSAIEKNPDWAPLYAGLAEVWIWIQQAGWEPPSV
ncbi:MAG: protein kinase, partial [Candidatus Aminicenantes bacterium]|nr:protein kinase [Candidatus Aminicenantes bacterium]